MARNTKDLLTLIDQCSEPELMDNLNILKLDFSYSDKNVSWLSDLTEPLKTHSSISALNLYEQILMFVEIRKLASKIYELNDNLTAVIKSRENLCQNQMLNFNMSFADNLQMHKVSCENCTTNEKETDETTEGDENSNSEIRREYYPAHIVKYVRSLDKCNVSTVRLRPGGFIECLLCHNTMSQAKKGNIMEHMCGKRHLSKVLAEYKNLVEFHKFWRRQTPEIWKKHLQFVYSANCLICCVCKNAVEYLGVADHLEICMPGLVLNKRILATPRGPYPIETEDMLFKDVPFIQLGEQFYPVFQCDFRQVLCLICNVKVTGDHQDHIESPEHAAMQKSELILASLKMYHDVWSALPRHLHRRQTRVLRGLQNMTCVVCNMDIDYSTVSLRDHVKHKGYCGPKFNREGSSRNKHRKKRRAQKSRISTESSSLTPQAMPPQEPANLLPISDNNKPDFNEKEHEPAQKRIKIEEGTAEPTVNSVDEKTPPGYVYYDYKETDFIPLERDSPKVTSELVLNPTMVKIEPSCSDNDTNVVDGVYQENN